MLRGRIDVGLVVEQFLDAQQDLLHCDVRLPVFLLVENREADCSGGIDVGMREDGLEDALGWSESECLYLTGKSCEKSMTSA